jgi:2-C-methyl-D-erythritol 4-phosphate cytidylyltransferase / 2-C-methyl-D-erythritol 2,4-cyclodiphosphate synthase
MAVFSVLVLTAPPPGQAAEAGGAFVKLDGREALVRAVELFLNRDNVKQIQVVFDPAEIENAKKKFGPHFSFSAVKVLTGGPRWIDQIAAAEKISADATHVIVHDGARPIVPFSDIDALMESANDSAVALATPSRTTLIETDDGGNPVASHVPTHFMQLLTPQVYSKSEFANLAKSKQEIHPSKLKLLKASPLNIRIGGAGDERLAKSMLALLPKKKVAASSPFEEAQW